MCQYKPKGVQFGGFGDQFACSRAGEGSGYPPRPPLYGFMTLKSRESVETIDAPQIYGCSKRPASSYL